MPPIIRLTPQATDDKEQMPVAFEAERDLLEGRTYVDADTGELVTKVELDARLKKGGKRVTRVLRAKLSYRLTTDPEDNPRLRQMVVVVPVIGEMDTEELGRVLHTAARNLHRVLARRKLPDE